MNTRVAMTLALVAGCSWGAPAPVVLGVAPPEVVSGVEAVLTVTVTGLDAVDGVDFDDPSRGEVCDYFRVVLRDPDGGSVELRDVVRTAVDQLRGRLEGDVDPAAMDVRVIDSIGRVGTLRGGFEVTKCGLPSDPCDDGNDCTAPGTCHDANRCDPGLLVADATPCTYPCTYGDLPGSCLAGLCVPEDGACAPAPAACAMP